MDRCRWHVLILALIISANIGCYERRKVAPPSQGVGPAAFRYAIQRPATTTDSIPPPRFQDTATASGLNYRWTISGLRPLTILQSIGNGCAFLDVDRDGNLDILLVGTQLALYHGDGKGHFADMTIQTGLDCLSGHFLGCAVGDYDNDGFPDLYISAYRGGALLHNEPTNDQRPKTNASHSPTDSDSSFVVRHSFSVIRRFREVTREAGIAPQPWGTSCTFTDLDRDGLLDLYICNYVHFDTENVTQLCTVGGVQTGCGPTTYQPIKGVLYRNLGQGKFADITEQVGGGNVAGRGLGVVGVPLDDPGRLHLMIANDELPGDLLTPNVIPGQIRLVNRAQETGVAFDRDGNVHGGMGVDAGDYDNNGAFDIVIATYQNEPRSLYHNDGGIFLDRGPTTGLGREISGAVGFGCKFLDYDNDGWLDIVIVNGHVQDNIAAIHPDVTYRQRTHLLHNSGGRYLSFQEVGAKCAALQTQIVGRGLAIGDYDNDGRMDILIADSEGNPQLLHNEQPQTAHWLGIRLVGTKSNRDGYGAIVTAKTGKFRWVRYAHSDGSYLSASDSRIHLGIGSVRRIESLTVQWPDGAHETYRNLPVDRYLTLREGSAHKP